LPDNKKPRCPVSWLIISISSRVTNVFASSLLDLATSRSKLANEARKPSNFSFPIPRADTVAKVFAASAPSLTSRRNSIATDTCRLNHLFSSNSTLLSLATCSALSETFSLACAISSLKSFLPTV